MPCFSCLFHICQCVDINTAKRLIENLKIEVREAVEVGKVNADTSNYWFDRFQKVSTELDTVQASLTDEKSKVEKLRIKLEMVTKQRDAWRDYAKKLEKKELIMRTEMSYATSKLLKKW